MKLFPPRALSVLSFLIFTLPGCGGSSSPPPPPLPPPKPTITRSPPTTAAEGVAYSYQLAATSSDSSAITFSLTASPSGATLSGNTVSWTPTHGESRVSNSFTVTATTAAEAAPRNPGASLPMALSTLLPLPRTGRLPVPSMWLRNGPSTSITPPLLCPNPTARSSAFRVLRIRMGPSVFPTFPPATTGWRSTPTPTIGPSPAISTKAMT